MDPQATLTQLLMELSLEKPDRDDVMDLVRALDHWLYHDGFLPKVTRTENGHFRLP